MKGIMVKSTEGGAIRSAVNSGLTALDICALPALIAGLSAQLTRTAGHGLVSTLVWQAAGDSRPYADPAGISKLDRNRGPQLCLDTRILCRGIRCLFRDPHLPEISLGERLRLCYTSAACVAL